MPLPNATIAAFICCLAGATLEGLLSGTGAKTRFAELRMPKYSPPFWLWLVIGIAYYGQCFFLLQSLFSSGERSSLRLTTIVLILLLLVGNAVWNYTISHK